MRIDKNSLWGGLNIQKRELCVKGSFGTRSWVCLRAFSGGIQGDFRGRGGEGALSAIGRGSTGGFEAHPGTPGCSRPLCLTSIQAIDYCYIPFIGLFKMGLHISVTSRNRENGLQPSSRTPGPLIRTLAIEISQKAHLGAIFGFWRKGNGSIAGSQNPAWNILILFLFFAPKCLLRDCLYDFSGIGPDIPGF